MTPSSGSGANLSERPLLPSGQATETRARPDSGVGEGREGKEAGRRPAVSARGRGRRQGCFRERQPSRQLHAQRARARAYGHANWERAANKLTWGIDVPWLVLVLVQCAFDMISSRHAVHDPKAIAFALLLGRKSPCVRVGHLSIRPFPLPYDTSSPRLRAEL